MIFKPLSNNVLVKPIPLEKVTTSGNKFFLGLYIPDTVKGKSLKGEIIAKGNVDVKINIGDIVLYEENAGTEVTIDGDVYLIMDEKELYGILV